MDAEEIVRLLKAQSIRLGFDDARIASADPADEDRLRLLGWLNRGKHGDMSYMAREPGSRATPADLLEGARSVLVLASSYHGEERPETPPSHGKVARYAWNRDYHRVLGKKLKLLRQSLQEWSPGARCRTFLDSSPLLERAFARKAGLGFVGKNTMLIHHGLGSWIFLAALITDLKLPVDKADDGDCGRCTLCLDACPTQAFSEPYVLDARKCISYWTIESKEPHPPELASGFGDWIFGCDVCNEVCPYNHRPLPTEGAARLAGKRSSGPSVNLESLETMGPDEFRRRFGRSPLTRPGLTGMARNARTARQNSLDRERVDSRVPISRA